MRIEGQFLYQSEATRTAERLAAAALPPHTLMRRAGAAVARLSAALAPHARLTWVACGPGNNGGDGIMAAALLHQRGYPVWASWLGQADRASADAQDALALARHVGLPLRAQPPEQWDWAVDALLGLGTAPREPTGLLRDWIGRLNAGSAVLAVDNPSGLNPDTGCVTPTHVRATHTLSLLTLKPGLFTAQGRDACGTLWFDDLGVQPPPQARPCAQLNAAPEALPRPHASHKGSYGDLAVLGGAPGMTGAAWLAGLAALHGGAGRVYVALIDATPTGAPTGSTALMQRAPQQLLDQPLTWVCGCGGGASIADWIAPLCARARALVLDADALNALASRADLRDTVSARAGPTVLSPHPLEAARLLNCSTAQVQADRLGAAQALVQRYQATVVLKGSGTIVAHPGCVPRINPTGDARLASAGTGDVLAGLIGARLAQGQAPFDAACAAVYLHGQAAASAPSQVCTADDLAQRVGLFL